MSTQSKEDRPGKVGFTVVFRLKRKGRETLADSRGAARELIAAKRAEAVVIGRSTLATDPILAGLYVVLAGDMGQTQAILDGLADDKAVEKAYVAPPRDVLASRSLSASHGSVRNQTWRQQVKLPRAQQLAQWSTKQPVTVAILDSGVDRAHAQLAHVSSADHLGQPPVQPDLSGHGSHVCGLVAATPHEENPFYGVAADCTQVTVHRGVIKPNDVAGYYRALRACVGARIINLSVGGEYEDETEKEIIELALQNENTVVVAASGNHREYGDPTIYPAAQPGVIAVAAVDSTGQVASTSSSGTHVLLAAPGVEIVSTVPTYPIPDLETHGNPPLAAFSGTSMAAPIVSGVIARMMAYQPSLSRMQVIDLIETNLSLNRNDDIGHGIVDADALLAAL
jgi:Subtilase family